jgi:hypothetical protein
VPLPRKHKTPIRQSTIRHKIRTSITRRDGAQQSTSQDNTAAQAAQAARENVHRNSLISQETDRVIGWREFSSPRTVQSYKIQLLDDWPSCFLLGIYGLKQAICWTGVALIVKMAVTMLHAPHLSLGFNSHAPSRCMHRYCQAVVLCDTHYESTTRLNGRRRVGSSPLFASLWPKLFAHPAQEQKEAWISHVHLHASQFNLLPTCQRPTVTRLSRLA